MASDRYLSHKEFHMARYGTPVFLNQVITAGDDAVHVFDTTALNAGESCLLMVNLQSAGSAYVSVVSANDLNEPVDNGVKLDAGEKFVFMTTKERPIVKMQDSGTAVTLRVFRLL